MQQQSLTSLLRMQPNEIRQWINEHAGTAELGGFNWMGLAEIARQRATQPRNPQREIIDWGHIAEHATEVAKRLGGHSFSLDSSMMRVRASLINRFGCLPGESLLHPKPLMDWFRSLVGQSPAEIALMARHWNSLPPEQVLALRHLKTGIGILQVACSGPNLPADSPIPRLLEEWRPLMSLLP